MSFLFNIFNKQMRNVSIGLIGGADGPTSIFTSRTSRTEKSKKEWQELLDHCKKTVVPRDRAVTGEEVKQYLISQYGAVETELSNNKKIALKLSVLTNYFPEAIPRPPMPSESADRKAWIDWAERSHTDCWKAAQDIPDEKYNLRYVCLQIPGDEKAHFLIELSTGYMQLNNGSRSLANVVTLWRGVTKEDIDGCTPAFQAYASAMREEGMIEKYE